MSRLLMFVLIIFVSFSVCACSLKEDQNSLTLSSGVVKAYVKGWSVYTNPAYRYELRHPKSWLYADSGEDGKSFSLYSDVAKANLVMNIKAVSNWQEGYSLEDFYQQKEDIYSNATKESIILGGQRGELLRDVSRQETLSGQKFNLIVFNLGDRIIEIELFSKDKTTKAVLNSLKFYSSQGIDIK